MGNQRIVDMWDIDCGRLHHAESSPLHRKTSRCTPDKHCDLPQGGDSNHLQSHSLAHGRSAYRHDACTN